MKFREQEAKNLILQKASELNKKTKTLAVKNRTYSLKAKNKTKGLQFKENESVETEIEQFSRDFL